MNPAVANPERLLFTLDAGLDHAVRLIVYGRSAVWLGFDNPPAAAATKDVDAIIPTKVISVRRRNAICQKPLKHCLSSLNFFFRNKQCLLACCDCRLDSRLFPFEKTNNLRLVDQQNFNSPELNVLSAARDDENLSRNHCCFWFASNQTNGQHKCYEICARLHAVIWLQGNPKSVEFIEPLAAVSRQAEPARPGVRNGI